MKYWEDFVVGVDGVERTATYEVTEAEIVEFGERFDPQPFHLDAEVAEGWAFGGLVAASSHLFAISHALANADAGKTAAISALGFDNMKLHAPARPGDVLRITGTVIEARPLQSRPEAGIMRSRTQMFNQHDELVMSYETASMILRRTDGQTGGEGGRDP